MVKFFFFFWGGASLLSLGKNREKVFRKNPKPDFFFLAPQKKNPKPSLPGQGGRRTSTKVILATNPTMTGEATAMYIADMLPERVRVTRLPAACRSAATWSNADELTLGRALTGRRSLRHGEE